MKDYVTMKNFLDQHGVTHEEMNARWNKLKETNMIIRNLSDHGQTWTDLPEHLLVDLINRTQEE